MQPPITIPVHSAVVGKVTQVRFWTDRQKDRKTERQKDRKTERQKDRKTDRPKDR